MVAGADAGSPARAERRLAIVFSLSTLAATGLAVVYIAGGQPQIEGALLGVAFLALGYGLVAWVQHLMPGGEFAQARDPLESSDAERAAFGAAFERGEQVGRRRFVTLLVTAVGALGVAALFPIRSLGPSPGRTLRRTSWRAGARVVTSDGTPVRVGDLPVDGVLTVFPEGHETAADSQVVLLRLPSGVLQPRRGREGWSPEGFVAYSKICTHAGCPVGLYQASSQQLLCPCHQSLFDVIAGARPVFGPAPRSLPQLPLAIDADGFLVAQRDFTEPVGPGFWSRG